MLLLLRGLHYIIRCFVVPGFEVQDDITELNINIVASFFNVCCYMSDDLFFFLLHRTVFCT